MQSSPESADITKQLRAAQKDSGGILAKLKKLFKGLTDSRASARAFAYEVIEKMETDFSSLDTRKDAIDADSQLIG